MKPIYIPSGAEQDIVSLYKRWVAYTSNKFAGNKINNNSLSMPLTYQKPCLLWLLIPPFSFSSKNQLDFNLQRQGSPETWSMTISLPNCDGSTKTLAGDFLGATKVGVWCHRCSFLENSMLAIGAIKTSSQKEEAFSQNTSKDGGTIILVVDDNNSNILVPENRGRRRRQRNLLQTVESNCATYPCPNCSGPLAVGSTSAPFDNCISLAPELQLFYTLAPSGDDKTTTTTFKGGLWAKTSDVYSSFGFSPDATGAMIGANAVVLYPDTTSTTGASVTGITLNSFSASEINAAKGSYPLTDTAATKNPDGSLSATFSVELNSSIEELQVENLVYIYVSDGPMLPENNIGSHQNPSKGSLFGTNTLNVENSIISSDSGTSNEAVGADSVSNIVDEEEEEIEKVSPPSVIIPTTTTTTTPSPSPSPSQISTPSSTCSLTIAGEQKFYESCYPVNVGSNFEVYYTFEADPLDSKSSIVSMAMKASSTGYVAVGFPSKPGSMINADAAILQACSSCPTGASIGEYYLKGYSNSNVIPDTRMNMSDLKASAANGVISGSWKVKLSGTAATSTTRRRRRLFQTSSSSTPTPFPASAYPLIYAAGPITSSGSLMSHTSANEASGYLNLLNGLPGMGGGDEVIIDISQSSSLQDAHMWLATISWGVLIPLAIIMARYFKPHTGKWFAIHRAVAISGFILAIVAVGLGFKANNGWETNKPVHRDLGISVTVLGLVQMFAVINKLRPAKDHKYRKIWFFGHSWIGRTAVILAIVNIYYGITQVAELGTWAWAVYTAVLGCIVALGLVMEVINWRLRKIAVSSCQNINMELGGDTLAAKSKGESYSNGADGAYLNGASTGNTSRTESGVVLTEIELN